jgi:hypothetical protein
MENNEEKPKTPTELFWERNSWKVIIGSVLFLGIVFLPQILKWVSDGILAYKDVKQAWKTI